MREVAILAAGLAGMAWAICLPGVLLCGLLVPRESRAFRVVVGTAAGILVMPVLLFVLAVGLGTHFGLPLILGAGSATNLALGGILVATGRRRAPAAGASSPSLARAAGPGRPATCPGAGQRDGWAIPLALVFCVVALVHAPAIKNDFVNWDDPAYVVENPHVHSLTISNLRWMLTAFHVGHWHPLAWFAHAVDWRIWGANPAGHHATNVGIHALNAVLVALLVRRLLRIRRGGPPPPADAAARESEGVVACATAILFGIHPLRVESVTWVSERKDLLCAMFFLLSLMAYLAHASTARERPRRRAGLFALSLGLHALALLAKPMAVSLPLVLILLDVYPLRRLAREMPWRPLAEKAPFFLLSASSAVVTYLSQSSAGAFATGHHVGQAALLSNALRGIVFYVEKTLLPVGLVPLYPLSERIHFFGPAHVLSWILVAAATAFAIRAFARGSPFWLVAWLYYLATVGPVIGVVHIGLQSAADRWTYLPGLSLNLLAGLAVGRLWERASRGKAREASRAALLGALGLAGVLLAHLTVRQIAYWRDSIALWERVVEGSPYPTAAAHTNLGAAYLNAGRVDEALAHLERALALGPTREMHVVHANLGAAYVRKGRLEEGIAELGRAIDLWPDYAIAHFNLALALSALGETDRAVLEFERALELDPELATARENLERLRRGSGGAGLTESRPAE